MRETNATVHKHLGANVGTALLMTIATANIALADTGVTGYSTPGNQLNPAGSQSGLFYNPDGLSVLDEITRSPTGLLYPLPYDYPSMKQSTTDADWWHSGWIETGLLGSFGADKKSASLNEYADWSDGPLATNLGYYAVNRVTGLYISGLAENIGRDDQYYRLSIGRLGSFDFTGFFDSIPHLYSTTAKSIWNGVGTNDLTLRGGLTAGTSTAPEVESVAASVAPTDLRVTRQKAGLAFAYTLDKDIEAFLQISNEWRNGAQPISATFGYPSENGATQLAEPVHYRTLDVTAAVRYKGDELQANLTYYGSFFHNDDLSLSWQNPGLTSLTAPGAYIPLEGRLSLPPSNSFNSLKADITDVLSPKARFSASVSYSLMRQNDALLPPTVDNGTISGVATLINLNLWNTTAALSRLHANAGINLFNAFAQFHYSVSPEIAVNVELRDHNEDNLTNYVAYNPQTGQYGYIAIDGGLAPFIPSLSGVYEPDAPGSLVQIRNMPFANDNLEMTAEGTYRIGSHTKIGLSYSLNLIKHSVREVPNADDNTIRLQIDSTGYSWGSVRVSYQFAHLIGSDYTSNPYTPYYSSSLPGYISASPAGDPSFVLDNLRKFDVANRDEHKFQAQTNYIASSRTDLQLNGDFKIDDYGAQYGLRTASSYNINADINYQASLATVLTGFFSFQAQGRAVANINPTGAGTSGLAGSPGYPLANAWYETLASQDYAAGLTARHSWDTVTLSFNYTYSQGTSALQYRYASSGAFFNQLTPQQAGNAFPDITFDAHTVESNLLWQYSPALSWRLYYRFDYRNNQDFHYAGLTSVIDNNIYLGVVPENYTVQTFGIFANYAF